MTKAKTAKATDEKTKGKSKHANRTSFNSETAKAAQKKSRESLKRNRALREWAKFYGQQAIKVAMPDKSEAETSWDGAVVIGLYRRAMSGDTQAAKFLAELNGQAPEQTVNVNANVKTKHEKDMTPEEAAAFIAELQKRI